MSVTIAIGSDHAGFDQKKILVSFLEEKGYTVHDFGTYSTDSVDYPDIAHQVADSIQKKEYDLGILLCGSGNGVAITANRHPGVRAALCWNEAIARLAKKHTNANILCFPARFVSVDDMQQMISAFLGEVFEHGRHEKRIGKIE